MGIALNMKKDAPAMQYAYALPYHSYSYLSCAIATDSRRSPSPMEGLRSIRYYNNNW